MNGDGAKKPLMTERNSVIWLNGRDKQDAKRTFIRKHAKAYPKLGSASTRAGCGALAISAFIAAVIAFSFTDDPVIRTVMSGVSALLLVYLAADSILSGINMNRFYKKHLDAGGEIIDPWNARVIRARRIAYYYVKPPLTIITVIFLCVDMLYYKGIMFQFRGFPGYFWLIVILSIIVNVYADEKGFPYIFHSAEEGMVFGGALFPYSAFADFHPEGNGFELYYDGRRVAYGVMLPDDMDRLREMCRDLEP